MYQGSPTSRDQAFRSLVIPGAWSVAIRERSITQTRAELNNSRSHVPGRRSFLAENVLHQVRASDLVITPETRASPTHRIRLAPTA